jgi:hypothetical protein
MQEYNGIWKQIKVIFAGYLLNFALAPYLGILQKNASQDIVVAASQFLDKVAKECFTRTYGWQSSLRIDSH